MYFNEPIIKTFNYFSQSDKSLGVLVQSKNFKGIEKNKSMYLTPKGIILRLLNHFVKMIKMTILTSVI